jgi:hypothetical protein
MSPASNPSMRRFRTGSAILLVCMSLPVADRLSGQVGAEVAALCVFILLFVAWFAVGLVIDAMWGGNASEAAEPGYASGPYLSQP